jgi:repressor LexA
MPYPARPQEEQELTVLTTIEESIRDRGYPPTQREISAAVGWASPSGANGMLKLMVAHGLIEVTPGIPRGLRITPTGAKMIADTTSV